MNYFKETVRLAFTLFVMTNLLAPLVWAEEPEELVGPPPTSKEFDVPGSGKIIVALHEKVIELTTPNSKKTIKFKGPNFGPQARWIDASLTTLGGTSYLEIKAASSPDGTSEIRSDLWWVVYEVKKNRFKQRLSRPIDNLTEDEFFSSGEYLTRNKTEVKIGPDGKVRFMLNDKELKP